MNQNIRIHLIDDDDICELIVNQNLRQISHPPVEKSYLEATPAIRYLSDNATRSDALPDIILLDLNMPVMDGWEFLNSFQKITFSKKIQIYILSSSGNKQDMQKAQTFDSVKGYLVKPLGQENLKTIFKG
jgi:CheY-like chemotaxis protein